MKKVLLTLSLVLIFFSLTSHNTKTNNVIVSTYCEWFNESPYSYIYFSMEFSEPSTIDYRAVVAIKTYYYGRHIYLGSPVWKWGWDYRNYEVVIPAGYWAYSYVGWTLNSGEQIDQNDYYIVSYQPN